MTSTPTLTKSTCRERWSLRGRLIPGWRRSRIWLRWRRSAWIPFSLHRPRQLYPSTGWRVMQLFDRQPRRLSRQRPSRPRRRRWRRRRRMRPRRHGRPPTSSTVTVGAFRIDFGAGAPSGTIIPFPPVSAHRRHSQRRTAFVCGHCAGLRDAIYKHGNRFWSGAPQTHCR